MRVSQVIARLQEIQAQEGSDLEIFFRNDSDNDQGIERIVVDWSEVDTKIRYVVLEAEKWE